MHNVATSASDSAVNSLETGVVVVNIHPQPKLIQLVPLVIHPSQCTSPAAPSTAHDDSTDTSFASCLPDGSHPPPLWQDMPARRPQTPLPVISTFATHFGDWAMAALTFSLHACVAQLEPWKSFATFGRNGTSLALSLSFPNLPHAGCPHTHRFTHSLY